MPETRTPINTYPLEKFIQQVKAADLGNQRDIRLDMEQAKILSYTLAMVMTRLNGDLEKLISEIPEKDQIIQVNMDGGSGW